jgi:hypothetical protein
MEFVDFFPVQVIADGKSYSRDAPDQKESVDMAPERGAHGWPVRESQLWPEGKVGSPFAISYTKVLKPGCSRAH